MSGISVVIPAYKEAENLKLLLPRLCESLSGIGVPYEVLVVDVMSPLDDTQAVCSETGCTYVVREGGNNYGDAIRTGFAKAQYEYCVVMDGDGSHSPSVIPDFYRAVLDGNDLVIGSRYVKGGNSCNNAVLKAMSWSLNLTYRLFFGLYVQDVSNSFRMYTTSQLKPLTLVCDNFDLVEEVLIKLVRQKSGFRILEIPIHFDQRMHGESKRKLGKFIISYIATMRRLKRV